MSSLFIRLPLVVNFSGQVFGSVKRIWPSRLGPRHCGQSSAHRLQPAIRQPTETRTPKCFLIAPPSAITPEVYITNCSAARRDASAGGGQSRSLFTFDHGFRAPQKMHAAANDPRT